MQDKLSHPPRELADHFTKPFLQFIRIESAAAAILLVFTLVALALSNWPWSSDFLALRETPVGLHLGSFEFSRSLKHWINDGLMTLFFFFVALELKRELVLGELNNRRMAALSFAGALGGMLVPAALYVTLQHGESGAHGWGLPSWLGWLASGSEAFRSILSSAGSSGLHWTRRVSMRRSPGLCSAS